MKVLRTNLSSYNNYDFVLKEKKSLESISDLEYFSNTNEVSDPEILITNTHTNLDDLNINWEKLTLIVHPNSGYDNFSSKWAQNNTPPIVLGNTIRAQAVVNYTLSCLFNAITPISFVDKWDQKRNWNRNILAEQNILLVGYGTIGQILEKSLSPIVKSITIYDPYKGHIPLPSKNIDIIILAAGLNSTSKRMINKDFLTNWIKDSSNFILINGARGGLVDEDDLISFAKYSRNKIYLDVFEREPNDFNKFSNYPNIFKTSHIAGVYKDLDDEIINFSKQVISDFSIDRDNFLKKYKDQLLQSRYINGILI